jgi:hypothetical protein
MIKGDIFLEKTLKFTIKNKLVIKLVLFIEYYIILLETINSVIRINEPVDFDNSDNLLSNLDKINPYRYLINTKKCSAVGDKGMLTCTLPTPVIFFGSFALYMGVYIIYKLKFESSLQDKIKQEDGKNFDMETYIKTTSTPEFLIINWFNLGIRIISTFLYFIIFNAIISSLIGITNSTGNAIDYPMLILGVYILIFASMLNYQIINSSTLMFPYKELRGHFGGELCKRYDLLLIPLKIIIPLQNNMEMMRFNLKFTHTYLSCLIIIILLVNVLLILSDMMNGKIFYVVNMKLNTYRLFFLILNTGAILYTVFFYDSFNFLVNAIVNLLWIFTLSIFITKGLIRKNELNILSDEKIVFLCIYLFRKMEKEVSNYESVIYEFLMHHKSKCSYLAYNKMDTTAYPPNYKIRDKFNHHCQICSFDDPKGLSLDTLLQQISHNKKTGNIELTGTEKEHYKMIKLILRNNDSDIIGLVYKVNKALANSKGDFNSFIKMYYNLISMKPQNQESIKRFTDIFKTLEVTNNNDDVIKSLNNVYDCIKSKDGDLLVLAEKLNMKKKHNLRNITMLSSKTSSIENYTTVLLRFVFEHLFNDELAFREEKSFYDYQDYMSHFFSDSKIMDIIYNHSQMRMQIMKCSHKFIEYQNKYLEDLFPLEIINEQKIHVLDIIKNAGSNEFEFECIINNLTNRDYTQKMKLNCKISYSLDNSDYFISGKYDLLDEEIILVREERLGLMVLSFTEYLGSFLHINLSTLKIFQTIGMKVKFNDIFSKKHNSKDAFNFNANRYLQYFESLVNEYEKQSHSVELIEVFKKLEEKMNRSDFEMIFSIKEDMRFKNYIVFTVKLPEMLSIKRNKDSKKDGKLKDEDDEDTPSVHGDSASVSQNAAASRGVSMGGFGSGGGDSSMSFQEHANNRKLVFYSRLLAIFSVLVIVYCFFLMYNGISDNTKMNESFNIKNSYSKAEGFYYHTVACLMNSILILDRNKANLNGVKIPKQEFVEKVNTYKDVNIQVQKFYFDSIQAKVAILQKYILDYEVYVSNSYYKDEVGDIFNQEKVTYNAMSIIGQEIKTVKTFYNFFEGLKVSANNLRKITPENDFVGLNIIDSTSSSQDYSNIPSVDIDLYQILTYETIINYTEYLKRLKSAQENIFSFHLENIKGIFSKSFMLSYILMAIHFILIFISILLIGHLSKIMDFNSKSINNAITKEINYKLMKRKLYGLSQLNKYFSENPSNVSGRLNKVRAELGAFRRKEEAEKKQKSTTSDYLLQNKDLDDESTQVFSVDKEKHLNPLSRLIFIMLSLYYVYSIIFILVLQNSTNNILVATEYFESSATKVKDITNSVNLIKVQILTNNTDYELYKDIMGDVGENVGYISFLHNRILKNLRNLYDLGSKNTVFANVDNFYTNSYDCKFIYYNTGDTTVKDVNDNYKKSKPGVDLLNSLYTICTQAKLVNKFSRTLLDERFVYDNYKQLFSYNQYIGNYNKMKEIIMGIEFQEILINFELIYRPLSTYINNEIINNIEQSTFDNFLMMSILYLALNILVDFVILFTFQLKIIKKIKFINDDLNMIYDLLRIY